MLKTKIKNSEGETIVLNKMEQNIAEYNQKIANKLGYKVDITTLTAVMKRVVTQKFFEISPADYMPIVVGEGAWSTELTSYRSFDLADDFETGVINTGSDNARLATADAALDSVSVKTVNWAKKIGWTLPDLQHASKAGSWDLITKKEEARKRNWDLGIQKIAFLGIKGNSAVRGLLNQVGITENTTTITKPISQMSPAELKTFVAKLIADYRVNTKRTAWPDVLTVPETDYLGMASQASADFPMKNVLQLLEEAFQTITKKKTFKIMPLSYGDADYNDIGKQVYALYSLSDSSLRMDIPVDYTNTMSNSIDGFSFQNVGYGQFTGALAYRPDELMYFTHEL